MIKQVDKIGKIEPRAQADVVEVLEEALARAKAGKIRAVGIAWSEREPDRSSITQFRTRFENGEAFFLHTGMAIMTQHMLDDIMANNEAPPRDEQ